MLLRALFRPLALAAVTITPLAPQQPPDSPSELTASAKVYGLSKIWEEAAYNFAYFDQVPDLNWDSTYQAFVPEVLATESVFDYYRALQRFAALLQDGHTYVSLPSGMTAQYLTYPWILTRGVQGRVLVDNVGRSLQDDVPVGSEVTAVNGIPAREFTRQHHYPYVGASTEHWRWNRAFEQVLRGPVDEPVHLAYVTPEGEHRERTFARDRRTRDDQWIRPTRSTRARFEFRWLENDVAYVAVNTFNDTNVVADFQTALPDLYDARALIMDIRRNGGGNSNNGYRIAAYLTDDTLQTSRWSSRQHVAVYKEWGRWNENYAEYADMEAWLDGGTHGGVPPANAERLIVPTAVLQGHDTFSAAEDFLVAVDAIPHVTTVGQATGGSTGQPLRVDLPGGGRAAICAKRDTFVDGREFVGSGVRPDVQIELTVEDVQQGRDPVLEAAVELLEGRLKEERH